MTLVALHLGAHKTGTSLVQKYLRDVPEQVSHLDIRFINRVDTDKLIGWGSHLVKTPHRLRERIDYEASQPGARVVFTSHENTLGRPHQPAAGHLYPQAQQRIEILREALEGLDVRIIFYLRRQGSFLESYYLQLVHQGECFSFDQWLDRVELDRVSWDPVTRMLRDAFGKDKVSIGDFDEIHAGQEAFLSGFFRRIDPTFEVLPDYKPRRNPSVSGLGLDLALAINPYLRTPDERHSIRRHLQANYSNKDYPRPNLFSDAQLSELSALYDDEYIHLIDRIQGR